MIKFGLGSVIKLFNNGNVSVSGLRGCGKDMLFANVIARRKMPYISNIDYHCKKSVFIQFALDRIRIGNNYENLLNGEIIPYDYPYPENVDYYISDAGIYFPSQYCNELVKKYGDVPIFSALSRHLGDCNFHFNTQNLNRVWDKFREQSDIYIRCEDCKVIKSLVIQTVVVYDKYDSAVERVEPFKPLPLGIFDSQEVRANKIQTNELLRVEYANKYGSVKRYTLLYFNKSKYDTRLFKKLFSGGSK